MDIPGSILVAHTLLPGSVELERKHALARFSFLGGCDHLKRFADRVYCRFFIAEYHPRLLDRISVFYRFDAAQQLGVRIDHLYGVAASQSKVKQICVERTKILNRKGTSEMVGFEGLPLAYSLERNNTSLEGFSWLVWASEANLRGQVWTSIEIFRLSIPNRDLSQILIDRTVSLLVG